MTDLQKMLYTSSHEWVLFISETVARVGITDFAQKQLGDLVFVNLPEAGEQVTAGQRFADVESVKGVTDVLSPVSGTVSKINAELLDAPQLINEQPHKAWFIEVENISAKVELLDEAAYAAICIC